MHVRATFESASLDYLNFNKYFSSLDQVENMDSMRRRRHFPMDSTAGKTKQVLSTADIYQELLSDLL